MYHHGLETSKGFHHIDHFDDHVQCGLLFLRKVYTGRILPTDGLLLLTKGYTRARKGYAEKWDARKPKRLDGQGVARAELFVAVCVSQPRRRVTMAEISYYDADLTDALDKLNDIMSKLPKAPPGVRPEMLNNAEKKLKEIIELRKGYQLALRQAPREQAKQFREKFEDHCARVEELTGEVKWAKSEQERSGLFGERTASGKTAKGGAPMGNKEMLDKALDVQKKTEQSLMSTQKMVEQSKEVAIATGEQLRDQRNQIVTITDEVMRMEDNLQRADRLIRTFARRMATDRVILFFTFLVFVGIAAIVVYKSVNPNDKTFYVPDEVTPPNPVTLYNKTVTAINNTINGS